MRLILTSYLSLMRHILENEIKINLLDKKTFRLLVQIPALMLL